MKRFIAAALLILSFAGTTQADVLWYALENGSRADIVNEIGVELAGRIGVYGCGENERNPAAAKASYPFYAFKLESTPEALEPHLHADQINEIRLFGGTGGVTVSALPSMTAYRDGRVFSFQWYLQQQLEGDYGNEASIMSRIIMLDDKQKSTVSFIDQQQVCPDRIRIHLKVIDQKATYKSERNPDGGTPLTTPTSNGYKETVVGHVTIVATAIPDSLEKVDEGPRHRHAVRALPVADRARRVVAPVSPQSNNPDQAVSVEDLQGSPKPQPRIKRLLKRVESE